MRIPRWLALAPILILTHVAQAQVSPDTEPGALTVTTSPPNAWALLRGSSLVAGVTPLELPPSCRGRLSTIVQGEGLSRTQGVIYVSPAGGVPRLLSERPGPSMALLVRSLNYPGIPDISSAREPRGFAMAIAASGAAIAGARSQLLYGQRNGEDGGFAADRARDERRERNRWLGYGAAVWAASAVDYWIRPRLEMRSTSSTSLTLTVPTVSRAGVVYRSLLVPGAGHEYANHRLRGLFWLTATFASAAGFVVAEGAVDRKQTGYNWSRVAVDSAGPVERVALLHRAQKALSDLQSVQDLRNSFRTTTLAIYAASVLDALLVPITPVPAEHRKISASMPLGPDRIGLALTYRY